MRHRSSHRPNTKQMKKYSHVDSTETETMPTPPVHHRREKSTAATTEQSLDQENTFIGIDKQISVIGKEINENGNDDNEAVTYRSDEALRRI